MTALIIAAAAIGYLVHLYAWPFKPCGRCHGSARNRGSSRRAFGSCKRCGGTGRRQRIGSRQLHRAVRSGTAYRNRDK